MKQDKDATALLLIRMYNTKTTTVKRINMITFAN